MSDQDSHTALGSFLIGIGSLTHGHAVTVNNPRAAKRVLDHRRVLSTGSVSVLSFIEGTNGSELISLLIFRAC